MMNRITVPSEREVVLPGGLGVNIEGLPKSGKSTILESVARHLSELTGRDTVYGHDPYDAPDTLLQRHLLARMKEPAPQNDIGRLELAFLFTINRCHLYHHWRVDHPHTNAVFSRGVLSTGIFQGHLEFIGYVHSYLHIPLLNWLVILDIPYEVYLRRVQAAKDCLWGDLTHEHFEVYRQRYWGSTNREIGDYGLILGHGQKPIGVIVDANQTIEGVQAQIFNSLATLLACNTAPREVGDGLQVN